MPDDPGSFRWRPAALLLIGLLCLIWGSTWLVIAEGLDDLPPFTSAALRFALAFAVMCGVAQTFRRREGGVAPPLRLVLVAGVLQFGVSYGVVYWTETRLPSGLVSVLWAVFPLMVAFLGHRLLPGERLRLGSWLGFGLGFVGVALLFVTDVAAFGPAAVPAALILLLAPAVSAVSNVAVKRYGERVSSVLLNRNGMFVGAILLAVTAVLTERDVAIRWTPMAVFSIVYLAIPGTVVTFGLYFWLLRSSPVHHLSLIAYVTPVLALVLGWIFRGERIGLDTVLGSLCVLAGVYLVARRRRRVRT
ncbi:MAG: EamA family transporter [Planctomycetes bacterium]|nr:EamA family transporter [Planctomycetota bacterium]